MASRSKLETNSLIALQLFWIQGNHYHMSHFRITPIIWHHDSDDDSIVSAFYYPLNRTHKESSEVIVEALDNSTGDWRKKMLLLQIRFVHPPSYIELRLKISHTVIYINPISWLRLTRFLESWAGRELAIIYVKKTILDCGSQPTIQIEGGLWEYPSWE